MASIRVTTPAFNDTLEFVSDQDLGALVKNLQTAFADGTGLWFHRDERVIWIPASAGIVVWFDESPPREFWTGEDDEAPAQPEG